MRWSSVVSQMCCIICKIVSATLSPPVGERFVSWSFPAHQGRNVETVQTETARSTACFHSWRDECGGVCNIRMLPSYFSFLPSLSVLMQCVCYTHFPPTDDDNDEEEEEVRPNLSSLAVSFTPSHFSTPSTSSSIPQSLRRGWSRSHPLGTEWPEWRYLSRPAVPHQYTVTSPVHGLNITWRPS